MLKDFTLQKQKDFQMNRNIDIYPRSATLTLVVAKGYPRLALQALVGAKLQPPV